MGWLRCILGILAAVPGYSYDALRGGAGFAATPSVGCE